MISESEMIAFEIVLAQANEDLGAAGPLRMDPEMKARWIAALRSGKFQQGQKALREGDGLCCLGVICELLVESGDLTRQLARDGVQHYSYGLAGDDYFDRVTSYLHDRDSERFNLPPAIQHALAALNDSGATFEEIANIIEEKL